MIGWLLRLALRRRFATIGLAVALLVVGIYRASRMPVNVFPDLTAPRVTVVTESTGMAAEEVEQLISFPIEAAVNGTAGLRRVRSASAPGISVVWAEFDWNTTQTIARQRVTERLQSITGTLPTQASAPRLAPAASVMGEIAFVALTSDKVSSLAIRRVADVQVRRRLLAVRGVSQVMPIGGQVKQYQILVDPTRIEPYELTLADVAAAVARGSENKPGGYLVDRNQEAVIRVLGRARRIGDLEQIVITTREGTPVRVRDVARVRIGPGVSRGTAGYNGRPAVLLSVIKQPSADTLSTTARLDAALDELGPALARRGIRLHREVFRQQDFIEMAIDNVLGVLRDGAALVILVLLLFLWSFRPTLISALAIPLSMVTAVLVLDLLGLSIDTMTLGGLAIAIGELVDDAIVDVENVTRRLRQRAALDPSSRRTVIETVLRASLEIRPAIVSATLILMLVFVPLVLLGGLEGRLLRPLALAYLVAIFASLVVAITVTPVLCSLVLPRSFAGRSSAEPPLIRWIGRGYEPILRVSLRRPIPVLGAALVLVVAGVVAFTGLGRSLLPQFNEGSVTISMVLAPGTPLRESDALARMAERALLADPGVISVGRRTGRAERDEHVQGVEASELEVRISREDDRTRSRLFSDLRARLEPVPARFSLGQPISHRIEHMISGQRSMLAIKVFGDDLRELRRVARRVESAIGGVPGLVDLNVEQIVDIPQLVVRVDALAASSYGLSAGEAADAISTALWGKRPAQIYEESTATPVVVKYPPALIDDLDALRRIRIPTPSSALVPISAVAKVTRESGANYVLREDVQRRVVVTANVVGGDVRRAYEQVKQRISKRVKLPRGVWLHYAGQFERAEATGKRLLLFGALALLGIGFIVAATLDSTRRALIVLANLPLALAGGVVGVYLAGGVLSVATTIGFITLFGIATRNGLLLATRTRDLEAEGVERVEAVARAARERLSPILMTAVTAALGLLPLALALGKPGSEIQAPMALVILTGLVTSTALNMVVVPALLSRWGGSPARPSA